MRRYRLPILLALAVSTLAAPTGASAACSSSSPLPADRRAANLSCDGVHPGMLMIVPSMKWGPYECAASFAFADQFGNRYLSFPGSCFLDYDCLEDSAADVLPPPLNEVVHALPVCIMASDSELEPVYKNNGPVVTDAVGHRIGRIAYAVNKDYIDFALVRLDRGVRLDPSVPFYGGPTRLGTARTLEETYVYSPEGMPASPNARSGVLTSGGPEMAYVATEGFLSRPTGASVMKPDGTAVGFFNGHLTITGYITSNLGPGLERAQRRTKLRLSLMTARMK